MHTAFFEQRAGDRRERQVFAGVRVLANFGELLRADRQIFQRGIRCIDQLVRILRAGRDIDHVALSYRNPFAGTRLSEDDVAVADLLERMGAWARGEGAEPYPLADGLQDHLISVAIGESAESGRDVTTEREAWAR